MDVPLTDLEPDEKLFLLWFRSLAEKEQEEIKNKLNEK